MDSVVNTQIVINNEQGLFVIPSGNGYSCLGFNVCKERIEKLSAELGEEVHNFAPNTIESYNEYIRITEVARNKNAVAGWRSSSELIPEFIGREGERVEVVTCWGETNRFYIGKSTGFIPCHIEVKKSNSSGGSSVCGYPFKSVKFLGKSR